MKIKSLICLSLLAVGCAAPTWADAGVSAGDSPGYSRPWQDAVLVRACNGYDGRVCDLRKIKAKTDAAEADVEKCARRVAEARAKVMALLQEYPEQINDIICAHGCIGTPLFFAVRADDAEMVRLMLDLGAIPYLSQFPVEHGGGDMLTEAGGTGFTNYDAPSPEISRMIREARAKYNVLESLLLARRMGVTIDTPFPTIGKSGKPTRRVPVVDDGYPDDAALRQQYGPTPDRTPRYIPCRGHMCLLPWNGRHTGIDFLPACTRGSDGSRMEDGHPYYSPLIFAMLDDERMNHPLRGVTYEASYIQGLTADKALGLVLQLIEENKDNCVNDCYNRYTSPLSIAVRNNNIDLARLLLRKGADPRRCPGEGLILLRMAADFGNVEMVKLLLRRGANPLPSDGRAFSHPYDETENDPAKLKCRILILEAQTRLLAP